MRGMQDGGGGQGPAHIRWSPVRSREAADLSSHGQKPMVGIETTRCRFLYPQPEARRADSCLSRTEYRRVPSPCSIPAAPISATSPEYSSPTRRPS